MKAADLVFGDEYEITSQPNPSSYWPRKFEPGRVKLIGKHPTLSGYYLCEYLDNPYSTFKSYDGKGQITVSGRSLLRPWEQVVAEEEEQREWQQTFADAQIAASKASRQIVTEMEWLQAEFKGAEPEFDLNDLHIETSVTLTVPLSVLRGMQQAAEKSGAPEPIKAQVDTSALSELI